MAAIIVALSSQRDATTSLIADRECVYSFMHNLPCVHVDWLWEIVYLIILGDKNNCV